MELGRLPIELSIKIQSLLYLVRILNSEVNPLLHEALFLNKSLDSKGCYSWYTYIKHIAQEAGLEIRFRN